MKKIIIIFALIMVAVTGWILTGNAEESDLSLLSGNDLEQLCSDIECVLKAYHTEIADEIKTELSTMAKNSVTEYFAGQNISISWPWEILSNYTYARSWNLYSMTTSCTYTDQDNIKHNETVFAEMLDSENCKKLVYLTVGTQTVIDSKKEITKPLWSDVKTQYVNQRTQINLSEKNKDELTELQILAKQELSLHHSVEANAKKLVKSMVETAVDDYVSNNNAAMKWSVFNQYSYECNWNCYTEKVKAAYSDPDGNREMEIYAEAYCGGDTCTLLYLTVGNSVVIDERSSTKIPEYKLWQNSLSFSQALQYMNEGNNETALSIFKELSGFSNSKEFAQACQRNIEDEAKRIAALKKEYQKAEKYYSDQKYSEAREIYEKLNGYSDSAEKTAACQAAIEEQERQLAAAEEKYQAAMAFYNEQSYQAAEEAFAALDGYSDSKAMLKKCRESIKEEERIEAQRETDYKKAEKLYNSGSYEQAKKQFESLGEYRDSEMKADACQNALNAENQKKEEKAAKYENALDLYENEKYVEALAEFTELGNYQKSTEKAKACQSELRSKYKKAEALYFQKEYAAAAEIYTSIAGYSDSTEKAAVCQAEQKRLEEQYAAACQLKKDEQYEEAETLFLQLGNYGDSMQMAEECHRLKMKPMYESALQFASEGAYQIAYDIFVQLEDYQDSQSQAKDCKLHIESEEKRIEFTASEYKVAVGKAVQIKPAVVTLSGKSSKQTSFIYQSSDENIVKISSGGMATALSPGTVTIRCSAKNNPYISNEITVVSVTPVSKVELNRKEMKIVCSSDDSASCLSSLSATVIPENADDRSLIWTSSNENVLTVDGEGNLVAVSSGKAIITATACDTSNGIKKASCTVTVVYGYVVTGIALDKNTAEISSGKSISLSAELYPQNATDKIIIWSSSDEKTATVINGKVTGVAAGNAVITATSGNGKTAQCEVTVFQPPVTFSVSISAKLIDANNVGNHWSKKYYCDGKACNNGKASFTASLGQTVSLECKITENDNNPESDRCFLDVEITQDIIQHGYTYTGYAYVEENGGRFRGHCAEWKVTFVIRKR